MNFKSSKRGDMIISERSKSMSVICSTHQLCKSYHGADIVKDISMTIRKGEIYGFLGPNGAAKTTVMKMMTNLVKPTAGYVKLFDQVLTPTSYELLKRIGSMIESPIFYDHLAARDNLDLHLEYVGYPDKWAIEEALEIVGLKEVGTKPVREYSLGMKQRLGIARAISTKPELLILDEPINGLDPIGIKEVRKLFYTLSREFGMTLLISSHILTEIEQIADTIGVISKGRLVGEVTMENLWGQEAAYIELVTEDGVRACYVLEHDLKISNFKLFDGGKIRIYDADITQNDVTRTLVEHDVSIQSITRKVHTLEDYFLSMIEEGIA